jgi:hypothetical protein
MRVSITARGDDLSIGQPEALFEIPPRGHRWGQRTE